MKRVISVLSALLLLVSVLVVPAGAAPSLTATASPDHIVLTWTGDPATTQAITWRTDTSVSESVVQYKAGANASLSSGATEVTGSVRTLSTDLGDINIHSVILAGLSPSTTYTYRVGDGKNWSEQHTFTTAASNATAFKFLVFGDTQSGYPSEDYSPWDVTLHSAYAANPDAKFMVNMGDLVEIGGSAAHWDKWFDAASDVICKIPEMPVQGNHETFSNTFKYVVPEMWINQFSLPQNGPEGLKGQCYSYDYGNVHFVVLDSMGIEEAAAGRPGILEAQAAWLDKDLSANKLPWVIVMTHKSIYYNVSTRSNEDVKAAFQPVFDKHHVDIVLQAHDHVCAVTYPMFGDSPVTSTSKGTVYITVGRSGNKYYTNASRKVWDAFYFDPQDQPTYNVFKVDGLKLTVEMVKQDGTPIYSYTIDKSSGKDSPQTISPAKSNYTRLAVFGDLLQAPELAAAPTQIDGVWYVPIRSIVQHLGGTVTWDGGTSSITLKLGGTSVIKAGSAEATVNGAPVTLQHPVTISKNITFVAADDLKTLCSITSLSTFMPVPLTCRYDGALNMLMITA